MALLAVVERGPVNGYDVIEAVRERTAARFTVSSGRVFPALHRLARNRMIVGSPDDPRRYVLTEGGRRSLAAKRREWADFSAAMQALLEPSAARR